MQLRAWRGFPEKVWKLKEVTFLWYLSSVHFPSLPLIAVCFQKRGRCSGVVSNRLGVPRSSGRIWGTWCPVFCRSLRGSLYTWSSLGAKYTSVELQWNAVVSGRSPWEPRTLPHPVLDTLCVEETGTLRSRLLPGMLCAAGNGPWALDLGSKTSNCYFIV